MGIGGGGGQSGSVTWPTYMRTFHENVLLGAAGATTTISSLLGQSPYLTAYAFDPTEAVTIEADSYLGVLDSTLANSEAAVTALSAAVDWGGYIDSAVAKLDAELFDPSYIDELMTAIEADRRPSFYRSVNMFAGGMFDVNAVHNTGFIIGLSNLEDAFQRDLNLTRTQLVAEREKTRTAAILAAAAQLAQMHQAKVQALMMVNQLAGDVARIGITAIKEQYEQDLALDVAHDMWNFDVLDRGGALLGSISGISPTPKGTSKIQSLLGGAMSGFSSGAQTLGGIAGPEGALIGGLLGGLGGGLMGLGS